MKASRIIGMALMAGGCASAPVNYYSLVGGSGVLAAGTTADCCRIVFASVKVPPAVDRPEIVVRRSDDQLLVLGNSLWVAPLRDEVRVALTHEIRRSLANADSHDLQTPDGPMTIHIDIERFESEPSQFALIQIVWHVTIPGQPHELSATCETLSQISVGAGVPALIQGHQRALTEIGARIASGILELGAGGKDVCASGPRLGALTP
jgi:uncharacterized protein